MKHGGRVAVALTATLVGAVLAGCGQRGTPPEDAYSGLESVPEKLDPDGTTITVGNPHAPVTVHLYEDPRCPVCEEFESTGAGPELQEATVRGEARTEYTMASFLDARLGGSGSKKAVNALRAALAQGRFAEYHQVLYRHQPEEAEDGFTDARLLELAEQVEGLRGPAFDSAVKDMKYRAFVTASEKAYESAGGSEEPGGPGTPTAVINYVRIPADYNGLLFDAPLFSNLLRQIRKAPGEWGAYDFPEVTGTPGLS
ncbi:MULTISPECIES: thioredoxin domain-containing protein [Streptomyces]|uniref:DsbA family protein n=1 Tax=Streptomyces TaxID=1883 RepID=UPI0001802714|nr:MULTISPECIES: thioredoxin domain-containing protein [Streptomyces]MYT05063.1 thioredoxin domain-containing protein [Streptomyces sp. SID5470]